MSGSLEGPTPAQTRTSHCFRGGLGFGFDATGSYQLRLSVFIVASLVAAGLLTRLGLYRRWEVMNTPAVASPTES